MTYPGITLIDSFDQPAAKIPARANAKILREYPAGNYVEYLHNSYGYRTYEFNNVGQHFLVCGGSIGYGAGLLPVQTYASKLEQHYQIKAINLSTGGAGATFVRKNIFAWTKLNKPKFVIAEWPPVHRLYNYNYDQVQFATGAQPDTVFKAVVQQSDHTFCEQWLDAIITTNQMLQALNIPCYNLFFDEQAPIKQLLPILDKHNIKIHYDQKTPDAMWKFDSKAFDGVHHSEDCNQLWADRIIKIIS